MTKSVIRAEPASGKNIHKNVFSLIIRPLIENQHRYIQCVSTKNASTEWAGC